MSFERIEDGHPMLAQVRLLEQLGPPQHKPILTDSWAPENLHAERSLATVRCACEKTVPVTEMTPFNTGLMNALDNVCAGCVHAVRDMCKMVCARCRAVVARVAPHKRSNGFVYVANRTYHLDCCAVCTPEIVNTLPGSLILEELAYLRRLGKTMPKEWAERQKKNPLQLR